MANQQYREYDGQQGRNGQGKICDMANKMR